MEFSTHKHGTVGYIIRIPALRGAPSAFARSVQYIVFIGA